MSFLDNLFASSTSSSISGPVAVELPGTAEADIAASKSFLATLAGAIASASMKAVLQAGTAVIGKLAANVGVNIGTVDINNALQLPATLGTRNSATSLGVTIANDQNPIPVTGSGTPLPVQGSVVVSSGLVTVANSLVATIGTSLPAGTANIGKVDVPQLPTLGQQIPANSLSVINATGSSFPVSFTGSLLAGGANIGRVDVASLPQLPAGVNNIGSVDLASIPQNNLATLASAISTGSMKAILQAGTAAIGKLSANAGVVIGSVDLAATPTANLASIAGDTTALKAQLPASVGSKAAVASLSVVLASDHAVQSVTDTTAQTKLDTLATKLDALITGQGAPAALYGGRTTVATAGTRVVLGTSQALTEGVELRGLDTNVGLVYPGSSTVTATTNGTRLGAKERVFIRCNNVNKVYIDAATSGEGVSWIGW